MVRAFPSHQRGPGLIPKPSVICGSWLLLVLVLTSDTPDFPSLQFLISQFQFDPESEGLSFVRCDVYYGRDVLTKRTNKCTTYK